MALTKRTGEVAGMGPGIKVLDVSSGRGTQAVFYAQTHQCRVTGVDLSPEMVNAAREQAREAGLNGQVNFKQGDSQALPFPDGEFDAVINECAVGIPDDSQAVLNEMVRVAKPGAGIVIHESTWRKSLSLEEKDEISERYGTTPLEFEEWQAMLATAGVEEIQAEFDEWSSPEMFWNTRKDRVVKHPSRMLTLSERLYTLKRVLKAHGIPGVFKALQNERKFVATILSGELGYSLFWGRKAR
jgi:ubiquinone/menaquinone biosynthesis C-methylase UbiE